MGEFGDILSSLTKINEEIDYGDELQKFFGTLCKFNKDDPIDKKMSDAIENYFDYRWDADHNYIIFGDSSENNFD